MVRDELVDVELTAENNRLTAAGLHQHLAGDKILRYHHPPVEEQLQVAARAPALHGVPQR